MSRSTRKIGVIGIVAIDCITSLKSPKFRLGGSTPLEVPIHIALGGMAGNFAVAVKKMGVRSLLFCRRPVDGVHGKLLTSLLETTLGRNASKYSIPYTGIDACSCISFVHHDNQNGRDARQRSFLFHRSPKAFISPEELMDRDSAIKGCQHIHIAGAGDSGQPSTDLLLHVGFRTFLRQLCEKDVVLSCDFVPSDHLKTQEWLERAADSLKLMHYILPSDHEARRLARVRRTEDPHHSIQVAAERLQTQFKAQTVIVKSGSLGCYVPRNNLWIPPKSVVDVIDPTGAGDVWCAGFAVALGRHSINNACIFANCAAMSSLKSWGGSGGVESESVIQSVAETHPMWQK